MQHKGSEIPISRLTLEQAKQEHTRLSALIAEADHLYYVLSAPTLSDSTYDQMRNRYGALETHFPILKTASSLSEKVGALPIGRFEKVIHLSPMLSLENAFQETDLRAFVKRIGRLLGVEEGKLAFVAEPKIDGLSCSLHYQKGSLVKAATRGDGKVGEDITQNVRTIASLPQRLVGSSIPDFIEVRGEIYLPWKDFQRLNSSRQKSGLPPFVNPRNAASGSVRQLNPEVTAGRSLHFLVHGCGEKGSLFLETYEEMMQIFSGWGLLVSPHRRVCYSLKEMLEHYHVLASLRIEMGYDMDGVVYKLNALEGWERLGTTSRSPRWALAYKFPAQHAVSCLEQIDIQVGRTGVLTPVARIRPISLGGVTVSQVSLHNEEEIARKDIRVGDHVWVERSGDVIPHILGVSLEKRSDTSVPFVFPQRSLCGASTEREPTASGAPGVMRRCVAGLACPYQRIEYLKYFVSKQAFDIDGLGEKQILFFFYDPDFPIREPSEIFTLASRNMVCSGNKLQTKSGFGSVSVEKLFASIDRRRVVSLERWIVSLGIRHLGKFHAKAFADHYGSLADFRHACERLAINNCVIEKDMQQISQVGHVLLQSMATFFSNQENLGMISRLLDHVTVQSVEKVKDSAAYPSEIAGKRVVFTGVLQHMTREQAHKYVEMLGGSVTTTVSQKTDLLICGTGGGKKREQAEHLHIPTMREEDWLQLIRNHPLREHKDTF